MPLFENPDAFVERPANENYREDIIAAQNDLQGYMDELLDRCPKLRSIDLTMTANPRVYAAKLMGGVDSVMAQNKELVGQPGSQQEAEANVQSFATEMESDITEEGTLHPLESSEEIHESVLLAYQGLLSCQSNLDIALKNLPEEDTEIQVETAQYGREHIIDQVESAKNMMEQALSAA